MTSEHLDTTEPADQNPSPEAGGAGLVEEWVSFPDIAERWGIPVTRVHNLVGERRLLAARVDGVRQVPALFLGESAPVESLRGTAMLLQDAGFTDEEAIRWLYTDDESLPGRPIDALRDGRKTEIRRRAQAMAW